MAPAAQVRRSRQERGDRGGGDVEVERWERKCVSLSLSFCPPPFFFPCDGCKAVDHAPDLSVFLIKILYLQAQGKKVESTQ